MTQVIAKPLGPVPELLARMRDGDIGALSRVVTELERLSPIAGELIQAMTPELGNAIVVGFTGAPGVGKSTLVGAAVSAFRKAGKTVGVIAVDPSSPISGGAILGDRLRMSQHDMDDGVFVRSLASRGALGGLTPAAVRIIDAFDGAGKDVVVIETVGAGQSEVDVAEVADIRIVVAAPGLGDDIQAIKAGVLEIADILVVNKADRPDADKTARELESALALKATSGAKQVIKTIATSGEGVDELAGEIGRIASERSETAQERRRRRARKLLAWAAADLIAKRIKDGGDSKVDGLSDAILAAEVTPEDAARALFD